MKTTIHIRAAEGGEDARLLAADLATSYVALCNRLGHRTERRRIGTGWDVVVDGDQKKLLGRESGGHRFQRIPPTEKRGRVQTSSVTVSVTTDERRPGPWDLRDEKHFVVEWRSGTGNPYLEKVLQEKGKDTERAAMGESNVQAGAVSNPARRGNALRRW